MKALTPCALLYVLLSAFNAQFAFCWAQGTAFTYQGRLNADGTTANGLYDFRFILYDADPGGSQIGPILTSAAVAVTGGLFTVVLDFGVSFPGADRWLDTAVRTNGGGAFTPLTPRQRITATPYALTAGAMTGSLPTTLLSGTLPSANLGGVYTGAVTFNNAGNSFTGSGSGLTTLNASQLATGTLPDARLSSSVARANQVWLLTGNGGTAPGTQFLGTTDGQPLEFKVNNQRALRIEPQTWSPNFIAGVSNNSVGTEVNGATIAGGGNRFTPHKVIGQYGVIGGGSGNIVEAHMGTISGGAENSIRTNAENATIAGGALNGIGINSTSSAIGGGRDNEIGNNSASATIAGGLANNIGTNSAYCSIGGGTNNTIAAVSRGATIAGGWWNQIETNSAGATIGGGRNNEIRGDSPEATIAGGAAHAIYVHSEGSTIGGGYAHTIQTYASQATIAGGFGNLTGDNGTYSTIGGGYGNYIYDNAPFATIPGGQQCFATNYTFAAGVRAKANHTGAFVWGDSTDADIVSQRNNQMRVRAYGGARFDVSNTEYVDIRDYFGMPPSIPSRLISTSTGAYLSLGGVWTDSSDASLKENFTPVDGAEILAAVCRLPIATWNYRREPDEVRHIGPTAQDFQKAFRLSADDKHIASLDGNGIALAAIQGLSQIVDSGKQKAETRIGKLEARSQTLATENVELRQELAELKVLVRMLAEKVNGGTR